MFGKVLETPQKETTQSEDEFCGYNFFSNNKTTSTMDFSQGFTVGVGGIEISNTAKTYVNDVLASGRLSYGKYCRKFEADFASFHDCDFAVLSNSGTSSLSVAIAALKEANQWSDGDEILVPSVTFVASLNIIIQNGLVPVIVDVERDHYGIDPTLIRSKITNKTKCIMVVHLFGNPCDMDPIWEIAKESNLKIIEDSCETMFAKYKGRSVGNLGDVGCFSTYIAHILVTGVGGLSTTNDPKLAMLMRSLVNHGRNNVYISIDDSKTNNKEKKKEIISRRFQFDRVGHSFRVTEMEAALGVAQLEEKDANIGTRAKIALRYTQHLSKYNKYLQLGKARKGSTHVFMMYPIVLTTDAFTKKNMVEYLEENSVETRDMLPLTCQPIYKKIWGEDLEEKFPVALWINKNGFYIGSHPYITEEQVDHVLSVFDKFFESKNLSE